MQGLSGSTATGPIILGQNYLHDANKNKGEASIALSIDMVLTDVVMPRMGGPELARQLSPLRPHVRWVFMSGYPDRARMPEVVGTEAPFLEKPFRPSQLGRTIRKVLDRHLA